MRHRKLLALLCLLLCAGILYGVVRHVGTDGGPATWELTQHPDATGIQGMFYSLVNKADGTLILIDGGNPGNADTVREVIKANGGAVDAWFLTHYHVDHIGAFNALWAEYRNRIGTVYVNPLDWETFIQVAHDWDSPESFSTFLEQTADADNIVTLHTGDALGIDGVNVKVYSAFDEHVRELSSDWPNDCSLVMKFSFTEDSVLFMGDLSRAGVPLGQYLLDTYGADELHADYVQAGHHGNWGQPIAFYEAIHPKLIFSDGPEWLMTGEDYDAKDLQAWCHENGIETRDYRQAPNRFKLK